MRMRANRRFERDAYKGSHVAYRYFRVGEFIRLLGGAAVFAILVAVLNIQFGIPPYVWAIATAVVLVGAVVWLGLGSRSIPSRADLVGRAAHDNTQERKLLALLKTEATNDPEYRDHALRTIREIKDRIETREAEFEAIAAMGQKQLPQTGVLRSKRILGLVVLGWISLFAIAYVRDTPKVGVVMLGVGALAFWLAQHLYLTKQPIYRKGGPQLEFEKEPATHTSAVLANCVLGLFLICVGVYAGL